MAFVKGSDIQLLIIPGIGEDERSSYPFAAMPFQIIRPRFIATKRGEPLGPYCHRYAESLRPLIDPGKPLFLLGISFGAPVVIELAQVLDATGVILISGYRSSGELSPLLRILGRHVSQHLPVWFYHLLEPFAHMAVKTFTRIPEHDEALCARMYRDFPKPWFRDQCKMAATWKGSPVRSPVLRIHGSADPIVPYKGQKDIDVLIEGDMHMCHMSEKEAVRQQVYAFIERCLGALD